MTTCAELRVMAKNLGIRGWSNAKKAELLAKLETHEKVKKYQATASETAEPTEVAEVKSKVFEPQSQEKLVEADDKPKDEPKAAKKRKRSAWDDHIAHQRKEKGLSLKQVTKLHKEDPAIYEKYKSEWKPVSE